MSKIKNIKALRQSMIKNFKEYLGGFRIGNLDSMSPIASIGNMKPPKGHGTKDTRGVGLNANKNPRIARKPGQKQVQINILTFIQMKIQKERFTD